MSQSKFLSAVPILASLSTVETVEFYSKHLDFETVHQAPKEYLIMKRDNIEIHFWYCTDKRIAENTACRIQVSNINTLYEECRHRGFLRSDSKLQDVPWGNREFDVFDPHGNLITLYEELE